MTVKEAAELCRVSESVIGGMIRRGQLQAHKIPYGAQGKWIIDMEASEVVAAYRCQYAVEGPPAFPCIRFHLTDEQCWGQREASFMDEGRRQEWHIVEDARYRCPACRSTELFWNGRNYYCDRCNRDEPILPVAERERHYTGAGWPYPAAAHATGSEDGWYARETRYIRHPAVSNGFRGRNDPKLDVTREGVPGHSWGVKGKHRV